MAAAIGGARAGVVLVLSLLAVGMSGCRREDTAPAPVPVVSAATSPSSSLPELRPVTASELRQAIVAPGASAVVVNVWATWCLPCRKEFPDLLRAAAAYRERGVRLVLVSADFEENAATAREFLARHGVDFPSYLKTGKDMEFIDSLSPMWGGALPATFVFDGGGALRDFWEGEASYETFAARIGAVLESGGRRNTGG